MTLLLMGFGFGIHMLNQMLAALFGGGDGDDDDQNSYYNLPENVRRSNICIYAGERWITIPLPVEYRAMYGIGELAFGVLSGNERYSAEELTYQLMAQVSQLLPLDMLEGGAFSPTQDNDSELMDLIHPVIPTAIKPITEAYIMNKGWTGLPIARQNEFNKFKPEFKRVYANADLHIAGFSRWLNSTTGGNDHSKGTIDLNPAKIEYLLNGYLGGAFSFPSKTVKWVESMAGKREFDWRNVPLANRVVKTGDERTEYRQLNNDYYRYRHEAEKTEAEYKGFLKDERKGILGAAEKVDFIYNSERFVRYQIMEKYEPVLARLRKAKEEAPEGMKTELNDRYYQLLRELVDALHDPEKYLESVAIEEQ